MRVRCKDNRPEAAQGTHKYLGKGTGNNSPVYLLTLGKEYVVYAVAEVGHERMYLLLDDSQHPIDELLKRWGGDPDPAWYDAKLFDVIDQTVDPIWRKTNGTVWTSTGGTWAFPEFAENPRAYYYWLIEGRADEVATFLRYAKRYEAAAND